MNQRHQLQLLVMCVCVSVTISGNPNGLVSVGPRNRRPEAEARGFCEVLHGSTLCMYRLYHYVITYNVTCIYIYIYTYIYIYIHINTPL